MKQKSALIILVAALLAAPAFAASNNGIRVDRVWGRATPGNVKTGAIYLTITNAGTAPDVLEGTASTPAAEHAELHEMKMENGVMEMRPVTDLTIDPGKTVVLAPGGYHLMLTGLKAPLKEGEAVPLTLTFAHAGPQEVTAAIGKVGAMHPNESHKPDNSTAPGPAHDMSSMPGMAH